MRRAKSNVHGMLKSSLLRLLVRDGTCLQGSRSGAHVLFSGLGAFKNVVPNSSIVDAMTRLACNVLVCRIMQELQGTRLIVFYEGVGYCARFWLGVDDYHAPPTLSPSLTRLWL